MNFDKKNGALSIYVCDIIVNNVFPLIYIPTPETIQILLAGVCVSQMQISYHIQACF